MILLLVYINIVNTSSCNVQKRDNEIFEPLYQILLNQKNQEIYARSGLFYLIKTEVLKENKPYGEKFAIEIDEKRAIPTIPIKIYVKLKNI